MCEVCPVAFTCAWRGGGAGDGDGDGDDPSVGSAGVSVSQPRFEGSDRQARGRLMKALSELPVSVGAVSVVMDRPANVTSRLVDDLLREGLIVRDGDELRLP
jgi:A/G-specific adenine glycosylase